MAKLIESESAQQVAPDVAEAAAIAFEGFQMVGIALNFQPGKTEAILHHAGTGSKQARHKTMIENDAAIIVHTGRTSVRLRCVHSYTHLGTVASLRRTHANNVHSRQKTTEAIFGPLRRRIFPTGVSVKLRRLGFCRL